MPRAIQYYKGELFAGTRLRYQHELPKTNPKERRALFLCECGNYIERPIAWVRHLNTTSCGCYKSECITDKNTKHSHAVRNAQSGTYRSWQAMHQRILVNPNYKNITICERWYDFLSFYEDMGDRPDNASTERKDNSGNYEPNNCKWATKQEQANNTRQTVFVTHNGKTQSINQWCAELGIQYSMVKQRRKRGMSLEDAIFTPVNTAKQKGGLARRNRRDVS